MIEYRPIPEEREEAFRELLAYAFAPEDGPRSADPDGDSPDPARIGERRGLFRGDDLLVGCRHVPFAARLGGETISMAGLTGVASPPEHRRRGLVRRLVAESLAEHRARGVHLSALWPFRYGFYRRLGWATANAYLTQELPVDALSFAREARSGEGRFVRLDADDWARLDPVHAAHGASYALAMDRSEEWWRRRVFSGRGTDPYVYGYERDGDLRGYIVYRFTSGDDGRTLRAWDLAFVDHASHLACLGFLADHDSQVETVSLYGPTDEALLDLVPEPDEVDARVKAGPMVRLVDAAAALEARRYPDLDDVDADPDGARTVVLDVSDPLAAWNAGRLSLSVSGGRATVSETDADPDAAVDVGALSQLYVGYRPVDDLAETGGLSVGTDGARERLSALFPPRAVFLREGF